MTLRVLGPGQPVATILDSIESFRTHDVRWREGRCFTLAYVAGDEALALAEEAYRRFSGENALNTGAFPSLRVMQQQVVDVVAGWTHGDDNTAGFMTSGGTESLVLAVRSARKRAEREGRNLAKMNMVIPSSAHAAFEKGADYFDVESRRVPVGDDWRANVDAMRAAVDDETILIIASAPQYPQGVIDPVAEISNIALERNINCHVDACMGGVTLTYLERLGEDIPAWDFRNPGVTSISVDLHKYGYTSKGSGVLLHRNKSLRADQTFITDNWLGGMYGSSGILGTKSGGPIASSWAVMHHLGDDGYARLTASARKSTLAITTHIEARPELVLRAHPDTTLVSFGTSESSGLDVFAIADKLNSYGWYVDRQSPPASIHLTVNAIHEHLVTEFLQDLDRAIDEAGDNVGTAGAYATTE
jgi:glutamate/tyrosine decarboxylase-like PLP-dependent enzyme